MTTFAAAGRHAPARARLGTSLLLSALAHGLLVFSGSAPVGVTLSIPAPELAVALAPERRLTRASGSPPVPPSRAMPAAAAATTEPVPADSSPPSPSDAVTNHLHSLLRESLDRHFIYPPVARRHGWEGRVELRVRLDQEGRLYDLRVIRSSGYRLLDEDALLTLRRIGSIPAARAWLPKHGHATTLPVIYRLTEG